jgi:LAG1, DNA binding
MNCICQLSMNANVNHFDRPILQRYLETRNRIGFGERTVIVMASKVAQKSYGQERRYVNAFHFGLLLFLAASSF